MMVTEAVRFITDLLDTRRYPRPAGRVVTLARLARLLRRLNDPHRDLTVVLVAGTKGKGSTAAMLTAVEAAAGRRVGLYTKPHLVDYRERIRINETLIAPEDLAGLVAELRPHVEAAAGEAEGAPTYFEVSVALALLHFARRHVDLAVLEVGLGGRLDATNICDPVLSVITPVSLDHTEVLGHTLSAIAREKVGIVRAGRSVVAAPQPPEVEEVLQAASAEIGAPLVRVGDRARWRFGPMDASGQQVDLRGQRDYGQITLPLVGRHQAQNAATAVVAAEELEAVGFPLPPEAVGTGLAGLRWPGRVEVVVERPTVVVDVAHNVASMRALADAFHEVWPGRRLVLVFGMVATHEPEGPAAVIAPLADAVVVTRPDHLRPLAPEVLASVLRPYVPQVEVVEDRGTALARALALAGPRDVVGVTGSFYLVGGARIQLLAPQEVTRRGAKHTASPLREGTSPVSGV